MEISGGLFACVRLVKGLDKGEDINPRFVAIQVVDLARKFRQYPRSSYAGIFHRERDNDSLELDDDDTRAGTQINR